MTQEALLATIHPMFGVFFISFIFLLTLILSFSLTTAIKSFAKKTGLKDDAKSNPSRKQQDSPIPLLGGSGGIIAALFGSAMLTYAVYFRYLDFSLGVDVEYKTIAWLSLSIFILLIGGYLDDRYDLNPKYQLLFINMALIVAVFIAGIRIEAFSHPFTDLIPSWHYLPEILAYIWLGFAIAATKFLDGHDGLVVSVGIVGFLTIISVSLFNFINQPFLALLAAVWITGLLPFWKDNFPDAKSYLGEGGSEIIGFLIGVLALFSGAKVATAMSVIGWFIMDLLFVWFLRILDKRNPITSADRLHWHFRLLDIGLTKIQVLAITVLIILITAHSALTLSTVNKIWLLSLQGAFLLLIFAITSIFSRRGKDN